MEIRPLAVPHCFEFTPQQHGDDRGVFLEWFRFDELEKAANRSFSLRQANLSTSKRGVVRGIHFSDVPRGQAKYVMAVVGEVVDFMIDLRVGSPTFGQWDSVVLNEESRKAVFIAEGVGHLFAVKSEQATVCYLASDIYRPTGDRTISPLDSQIALDLPFARDELLLSPKDLEGPTLGEAAELGILPSWESCQAVYAENPPLEGAR
jgi:dTDP-4-dehydrorhamnose 3,5-epimerase